MTTTNSSFRPRGERLDDRLAPAVTFRFDFSLDSSGFFDNPDALAALQRAAAAISSRLHDSLAAIAPSGGNTWRATFVNPATRSVVRLDNLAVGADEILAFIAAADFRGGTLGATGTGTADPRGGAAWVDTVRGRGQPGAVGGTPTDFGPWGGMIAFDATARWEFGPGDPDGDRFDFQSVAEHELAHLIGFGAGTPSFETYAAGGEFVGPTAVAVYGGPVPLQSEFDPDHWAEGTSSDGREAALTPSLPSGDVRPLTSLDWAALADVGWQLAPPAPPPPPIPPQPAPVLPGEGAAAVAVGAGEGELPLVTWLGRDGRAVGSFTAFPDGFRGGVRVAAADFDADGVKDVAVGTGPGAATRVRVLAGSDGRELFAVDPFEARFTGGVHVAAGDLTGDGVPDLVITPDEGGGPRVRAFDGQTFALVADFFGIEDASFRGGARAAVGDVSGDTVGDLLVAAGFGGGPRVAGFDGPSVAAGRPESLFPDFFAFEEALRNGVFLAAGDLDDDGFAELIAGAGPGGGPRVTAFAGQVLAQSGRPVAQADFFAGDESGRGGVRVAVAELDRDSRADLVAGAGAGVGSWAAGYTGRTVNASPEPAAAFEYSIYPGFLGGVFVG